jgi:hypothetical protein
LKTFVSLQQHQCPTFQNIESTFRNRIPFGADAPCYIVLLQLFYYRLTLIFPFYFYSAVDARTVLTDDNHNGDDCNDGNLKGSRERERMTERNEMDHKNERRKPLNQFNPKLKPKLLKCNLCALFRFFASLTYRLLYDF